jgi:hypothetical protein
VEEEHVVVDFTWNSDWLAHICTSGTNMPMSQEADAASDIPSSSVALASTGIGSNISVLHTRYNQIQYAYSRDI